MKGSFETEAIKSVLRSLSLCLNKIFKSMYNEKKKPISFSVLATQAKETLPFQKDTTKVMTIPKDYKYPELHGELLLG